MENGEFYVLVFSCLKIAKMWPALAVRLRCRKKRCALQKVFYFYRTHIKKKCYLCKLITN